jgi:hypothetical protein
MAYFTAVETVRRSDADLKRLSEVAEEGGEEEQVSQATGVTGNTLPAPLSRPIGSHDLSARGFKGSNNRH